MTFRIAFGYAWNSAWHGFGKRRYKDGEIWWVQLWHPTRRNLLVSNKGVHLV